MFSHFLRADADTCCGQTLSIHPYVNDEKVRRKAPSLRDDLDNREKHLEQIVDITTIKQNHVSANNNAFFIHFNEFNLT